MNHVALQPGIEPNPNQTKAGSQVGERKRVSAERENSARTQGSRGIEVRLCHPALGFTLAFISP